MESSTALSPGEWLHNLSIFQWKSILLLSATFLLPFCCHSVAFLLPFCSPFLHSSGPAFGQITLDHAVHYADLCAKELGCDEEQDVLACMQSRDIKDIIRSMTYIMGGNPK